MKELDSFKQDAKEVKKEISMRDPQMRIMSLSLSSPKRASIGEGDLVGLDDADLDKIKERLVKGSLEIKIIPIIGMGGIGKTILAKRLYDDQSIVENFHIRAWVTVSQDYVKKEIVEGLVDSIKISAKDKKHGGQSNNEQSSVSKELDEVLYKQLKGCRYLIVLDDMWDAKVWDDVKRLFPNEKNGSRIMLTSREERVAIDILTPMEARGANVAKYIHRMNFLKEDDGWNLFCQKVFGEDRCPRELEVIGKNIVKNCGGLPLAIVVIGGLLSKASKTESSWTNVAENLNLIASRNVQISRILYLSYNHLPYHLKECFLYLGIFPEDFRIHVPMLVKLWVAEGILQPTESTSLEDVAYECLSDLVDRNLVLADKRSYDDKVKICKIHDLLHDLCGREAQRTNFLHVTNENHHDVPVATNAHRVSFHRHREIFYYHCADPPNIQHSPLFVNGLLDLQKLVNERMLQVLHNGLKYATRLPDQIIQQVNLRYLSGGCNRGWPIELMHKLQNLQSLILVLHDASICLPPEIWKMTQLRHVELSGNVILSDPPLAENSVIALEDLQTLSSIRNFRCTEEVIKRIPNVKKLGISYSGKRQNWEYYCLNNLSQLQKLEILKCFFFGHCLHHNIFAFPTSLKRLTLRGCKLPWEEMTAIGSLLNLEVLKLKRDAFSGEKWEPNEGEFVNLKFLLLEYLDLHHWVAYSDNFPMLERLVFKECFDLEEIPKDIGNIGTLRFLEVWDCGRLVETSAIKIREQQDNGDYEVLQVRII